MSPDGRRGNSPGTVRAASPHDPHDHGHRGPRVHGPWYLTRATGLVSLVLLSGTVVLGIVASVGWTTERWPRFLSQSVHRNLSLLCLVLIAVHVVTTVADGSVPIGYLDAIIPFRTPYRPMWVGFGALALDMLLAVAHHQGLRRASALGPLAWCPLVGLPVLAGGAVARARRRQRHPVVGHAGHRCPVRGGGGRCRGLAAGPVVVPARPTNPCRPVGGHDPRGDRGGCRLGPTGAGVVEAGRHLAGPAGPVERRLPIGWRVRRPPGCASGGTSSTATLPAPPFTARRRAPPRTSPANAAGQVTVTLTLQPTSTTITPLVVKLNGRAVGGGVAMSSSQVTWGPDSGVVTALSGA